ncbi:hypothetical protein EN829_020915 [Mesorhizobium sp. M00.F.Ca.ET.186.01.1.1]|nr:hypothetical protein EN848_28440 [bacterium M00.F.Ca.ET.205.01.1.1]TGU50473.1 hypothetical protein EN795_22960 [bacterium M00.F.Ca.ET.152.01.1.1]TGV33939.1 hypothetical protein EN829_020915 [Mesorhizobium sp. M00.F.Ca.ET.186.01.1.1]TGZ40837.1 hypothetical protein EN805_22355 [bacterium M00.F.Ca.ET.162.01.1.1]
MSEKGIAMVALEHPPLSCRTSPPQGGRSDVAIAFANRRGWTSGETARPPISGRTEGDAKELGLCGKAAP